MERKPIKLKIKDAGAVTLQNLMYQIGQIKTSNKNASKIRKIMKEFQRVRVEIADKYAKEIMEVFGQKDEAGNLLRPEGEPNSFIPVEGKEDELIAANKEFGEQEIDFNWEPLNQHILADMKVSASDLETFGALYVEQEGPGIPIPLHSV